MYCILFNFVRNIEASIPYIVNCSNCLFFSVLTLGNKIKGENKQTKSLDEPSSVFQVTLTAPVKAFFFFAVSVNPSQVLSTVGGKALSLNCKSLL